LEKPDGGSINEGCGSEIKGCTGKGVEGFREHKYISTNEAHEGHPGK
jgi:hypothetical protein